MIGKCETHCFQNLVVKYRQCHKQGALEPPVLALSTWRGIFEPSTKVHLHTQRDSIELSGHSVTLLSTAASDKQRKRAQR